MKHTLGRERCLLPMELVFVLFPLTRSLLIGNFTLP